MTSTQSSARPAFEDLIAATAQASESDAQLVELARQGDQDAFAALMHRYERPLRRLIRRFVASPETADDLVQETFLRVFQRIDQFDTSRRFGPWLFRIGVNLTLDFLRRKKRRLRWSLFSQRDESKHIEPAVDDPRQQIDLRQEIDAVLEQIPEKYRLVLVLRDLENFPTSEIAAITKRKEGTIRWRLAEARQLFHQIWTERNKDRPLPTSVPVPEDSTESTEPTASTESTNSPVLAKSPETTAD